MIQTGKIEAISVSSEKGTKKFNVPVATLIAEHGIEGDAHAGKWKRQISFLAAESIESFKQRGMPELQNGDFAENITTSGIDFSKMGIGTRLTLNGALLEITQIGKKCHSRCHIFETIGDCIMPKEGVFAKVLTGGKIQINDQVIIMEREND